MFADSVRGHSARARAAQRTENIEEAVSAGGPLLAIDTLLGVTLVCSVAMPHSGGYIVWVHNAFDKRWRC
eukprot:jgi/Chrpa1/10934/Chrysochromulina_OHIO_Genome00013305-RA